MTATSKILLMKLNWFQKGELLYKGSAADIVFQMIEWYSVLVWAMLELPAFRNCMKMQFVENVRGRFKKPST